MERKGIGAEWVLIQDEGRLIVRGSWAGHITGVALLLVFGIALVMGPWMIG